MNRNTIPLARTTGPLVKRPGRTCTLYAVAFAATLYAGVAHAVTIGHPLVDGTADTAGGAGFIMFQDPVSSSDAGVVTDYSFYAKFGSTFTPLIFDAADTVIGRGTTRTVTTTGVQTFSFGLVDGSAEIGPGKFFGWQPAGANISPVAFNDAGVNHIPGHMLRFFNTPADAGLGATVSGGFDLPRTYSIQFNTADAAAPGNLRVDFQNDAGVSVPTVTQADFSEFENSAPESTSDIRIYTTAFGAVTAAISSKDTLLDGFFNRGGVSNGGSLTFADLYNDFVFDNLGTTAPPGGNGSEDMVLTLSGDGILPNQAYHLMFYSYDDRASQGTHNVSITATAGTGGPLSISYVAGVDPTTNAQYSASGRFNADSAGVLAFYLMDTFTGATENTGIRLNGFEIAVVVPEPESIFLLGTGLLGLIGCLRRKRADK